APFRSQGLNLNGSHHHAILGYEVGSRGPRVRRGSFRARQGSGEGGSGQIGAVIFGQDVTVSCVYSGGHNVWFGAQAGEDLGGGITVARSYGGSAVLTGNFSPGRELARRGLAKGERAAH